MRSRTNILPRDVCRFRASSPPPFFTAFCFSRNSATSCSMASRLACVSTLGNVPPDIIDDVFGRYSRLEDFTHPERLEFGNILVGNDATDEDKHIIELLLLHELHDAGTESHVSSGEHRKADDVYIFLQCCR